MLEGEPTPQFMLLRQLDELSSLTRMSAEVFADELGVISREDKSARNQHDEDFLDEWDFIAYNVGVRSNGGWLGLGRLVYNPGELGFRISSSFDPSPYFPDRARLAEISGLVVPKAWRVHGIGTAIHYFRLLLARELQVDFVMAAAFPQTTSYLQQMGFRLECPSFLYERYQTCTDISQFSSFNLRDQSAWASLTAYVERRCPAALIRQVESDIQREAASGLNYLPLTFA